MGYLIGDDMALMHPPKTAGIWARNACTAVGLPWMRYADDGSPPCQHSDAAPPAGRRTMMFVRHPVNWLKSFWMFHQRTGWTQYTDSPGFIFYANHRSGENFAMFVARYLDKMPGAVGRMFERFENHCDYIGKVETIGGDLSMFIKIVHPEVDVTPIAEMARLNASPGSQKLTTNYAPGQVDSVKRAEREFMSRWGYE